MPSQTSQSTAVIHDSSAVLSLRHASTFLLLAFIAGAVNAGALIVCERFVSHVTGTATRIGVDAPNWVLMAEYAAVLTSFVAGAFGSVLAVQLPASRGKRPLPGLALGVVAVILLGTGVAGHAGFFGSLGGEIEQGTDFELLGILAFAMGLMNATIASTTALSVRTTHMTGPATDFGVQLGVALFSTGPARADALRLAALRGGKVVTFILGGLAMTPLIGELGYLAFAVASPLVLIAVARSFAPSAEPAVVSQSITATSL